MAARNGAASAGRGAHQQTVPARRLLPADNGHLTSRRGLELGLHEFCIAYVRARLRSTTGTGVSAVARGLSRARSSVVAAGRVKHVPAVMVMCANDATAVVFACAAAFATRERAAAVAVLVPPLDRDCKVVVGAALLGWAGLMGNIKGYQSVSVAAVATVASSSSIPFNYAFQVLFFREALDALSVAGATIVVVTTVTTTVLRHRAQARVEAEAAKAEASQQSEASA